MEAKAAREEVAHPLELRQKWKHCTETGRVIAGCHQLAKAGHYRPPPLPLDDQS